MSKDMCLQHTKQREKEQQKRQGAEGEGENFRKFKQLTGTLAIGTFVSLVARAVVGARQVVTLL